VYLTTLLDFHETKAAFVIRGQSRFPRLGSCCFKQLLLTVHQPTSFHRWSIVTH